MKQRILIPTLISLLVLTLAVSSVSASSPTRSLMTETDGQTLVPGNYCVSCHLADDPRAWWIPANDPTHRYELLYRSSPASTIPEVHTPLTLETLDGPVLVIHEANLVDYAGMNLTGSWGRRLTVALPAWADGVKVRGRTPFVTPWRTIQVADRAKDLAPSVIGLNLNPPNALEDVSWIEPMKYVGIWWGMHINKVTWGSGPAHGATTENTRRFIDFAADNGFGGVLVEGWNVGWDGDWIANADLFSFTEAYPDYDLEGLAAYAGERGVSLIGHNETSMGVTNYERQMDDAFALYERLGIRAIKTGYVGCFMGTVSSICSLLFFWCER